MEDHGNDLLTYGGGSIKSLGDNRMAGYLVLFSDETKTDLVGDYFDRSTDFYGLEDGDRAVTLWHHGLDPAVQGPIGKGTLKVDDTGIWYESQLTARRDYEDRVADILRLVDQGKVGLSSGSPGHLVRRSKKSGDASHVDAWQIAEASLTCTPCEPHTRAISLKALVVEGSPEEEATETPTEEAKEETQGMTLAQHTDFLVGHLFGYTNRIRGYAQMKEKDGRRVGREKKATLKSIRSELDEIIARIDQPDPGIAAIKMRLIRERIAAAR